VQLGQVYQPPGGLWLATDPNGERLGCVGLKAMIGEDGARSGELRRLFVRPDGRSSGLGRALTLIAIRHGDTEGLDRLVLNTLATMTEAIALYAALGFVEIEPYVAEPLDGTRYFGRSR